MIPVVNTLILPRPTSNSGIRRIGRKKNTGDGTNWEKKKLEEDRSRDGWAVSTET